MIVEAMQAVADDIRPHVSRPVTIDARNMSSCPAVLVEPPELDFSEGTMCGTVLARFPVMVVGMPGGLTELRALDALLGDVLAHFTDVDQAVPVGYIPLNAAGQADPSQAYRLTVERVISWQ